MNRGAPQDARELGMVKLVGAGPGDPELLTIKAVRAIRWASVLLVDDLVGDGVLRFARRSSRIIHVGKRGGCTSTPQSFIEKLMLAEARKGERVVRLKGGDPFVFGRGGEEAQHLREQGIAVEVVHGITSGLAAAGSLGAPLTHRDHAHGVLLVTGHARQGGNGLDWSALATAAAQGLTLVIYMGISGIDALQEGLLQGLPADTPAAVVQHATLPMQKQLTCRLDALAATVRQSDIGSPAIVIVGNVLQAAQHLRLRVSNARAA